MGERDPLLGSREADSPRQADHGFTIPARDSPIRLRGMPEFVRTLGGGYFFVPGKALLQVLVIAPVARTDIGSHPSHDHRTLVRPTATSRPARSHACASTAPRVVLPLPIATASAAPHRPSASMESMGRPFM